MMGTSWPVYFLTRAPSAPGKRTRGLQAGDPFPWQDKTVIKRMGSAFGVPLAIDQRFAELDYVACVNVGGEVLRQQVLKENLNLQAVRALTTDGSEAPPVPVRRGPGRPRSAEVRAHG
jgi:hypothetical protein